MSPRTELGAREALVRARRVVVKIGTNALTASTGRVDRAHLLELGRALSSVAATRELVIVSSGAIALGVERLKLPRRPKDLTGKQACAAVGQGRLMRAWEEALPDATVAQVLLTHADVADRGRYLDARRTMERLLELEVIPVVNENDTVSAEEIKFGDNDELAAVVTGLVGAEALLVLSDVDGVYDADPRTSPGARRIAVVTAITPELRLAATGSRSAVGTGGMATKLRAAGRVTELGAVCVITSGADPSVVPRVLAGDDVGTLFVPARTRPARQAWIASATRPRGTLTVDGGAREAVARRGRSLLPSGIVAVEGSFAAGAPVDVAGPDGVVFARGLAAYAADELRVLAGHRSSRFEALLGYRGRDEAIHRSDLVIVS